MNRLRSAGIIVFLSILVSTVVFAWQPQDQDTTANRPEIIPVSRISVAITEANGILSQKWSEILSDQQEEMIRVSVDTILFRLTMLREDPRIDNIARLNFRSLTDLEKDWKSLQGSLQIEQDDLAARIERVERDRTYFESRLAVWTSTREGAVAASVPSAVIRQIQQTEASISGIIDSLASDSEFLQEKMVAISKGLIFSNNILSEITTANNQVSMKVFDLNQPPIWKLLNVSSGSKLLDPQRDYLSDLLGDIKEFSAENSLRIILHGMFILILFLSIGSLNRTIYKSIPHTEAKEIDAIKNMIKRPVSVTILLGFLSSYIIYGPIPEVLILVNTLVLLVPVILILTDLLSREVRRLIVTPILALVLIQIHSLGYSETLFSRLFIIIIIVAAVLFFLGLAVTINRRKKLKIMELGKPVLHIAYSATILLLVAFISVVSGAVMMAEFLTYAVVKSASLVIFIYALRITLSSIIYTLLYGRAIQLFNTVAQYHEVIYKRTERIIKLLSWVLWTIFTLKLFNIWDEVRIILDKVFTSNLTMGSIQVSLGDFSLFIIILVITIWLSRLVRTIIEGEIAPRVKMKRGVPGALALLLRIGIITIGFFFAAGAAGFGMDKMTILLGALGVGIGFGLQNIFNNLVSGIILAFERPIQEGDIIEVGELWGTVKEIGIRASTIFTFDGAEVIVPNGNLISNELINWTLTDRNRRVEVNVGVAYGTDPEKVLEILRKVSTENSEILQEPAPLALFSGFGESSLDFRLLFWIAKADSRFVVQSQVNVAVNNALKKAGMEIPFPQRDLHIRSVDPDKTRW